MGNSCAQISINLITDQFNQYNFKNLNDSSIIGQETAIKKLNFFAKSSHSNPIPTFLFEGSHGLGKTYLARKFAESINTKFVEVNSTTIKDQSDLIENVFFNKIVGDRKTTLFFDESHALGNQVTNLLLSILNPTSSMKNSILYNNVKINFDLNLLNVIFATTHPYKMFKPLVDRCEKIHFKNYDHRELISIIEYNLNQHFNHFNLSCDLNELAMMCRGRARNAFMISQNIKRFFDNYDDSYKDFNNSDLSEMKELFGFREYGIYEQEYELLKLLFNDGYMSLQSLACKLMVEENYVLNELEERLLELNLISIEGRGRTITSEGRKYLKTFSS